MNSGLEHVHALARDVDGDHGNAVIAHVQGEAFRHA
jgi:hypothetical protein